MYIIQNKNTKKFIAELTKTNKPGYNHLKDITVEWTSLVREAKQYGFKEANKIVKTVENCEIIDA